MLVKRLLAADLPPVPQETALEVSGKPPLPPPENPPLAASPFAEEPLPKMQLASKDVTWDLDGGNEVRGSRAPPPQRPEPTLCAG